MIISNESRIAKTSVVSNFRKPRQYAASISIRHKDMHLVDPITVSMKKWLKDCSEIDTCLPFFAGLASLDNHACNIGILVGLCLFYELLIKKAKTSNCALADIEFNASSELHCGMTALE